MDCFEWQEMVLAVFSEALREKCPQSLSDLILWKWQGVSQDTKTQLTRQWYQEISGGAFGWGQRTDPDRNRRNHSWCAGQMQTLFQRGTKLDSISAHLASAPKNSPRNVQFICRNNAELCLLHSCQIRWWLSGLPEFASKTLLSVRAAQPQEFYRASEDKKDTGFWRCV